MEQARCHWQEARPMTGPVKSRVAAEPSRWKKAQEGTGRTRGQRQKTEVTSRAETKQTGRDRAISTEITAVKSGMILGQSGTEEMAGAGRCCHRCRELAWWAGRGWLVEWSRDKWAEKYQQTGDEQTDSFHFTHLCRTLAASKWRIIFPMKVSTITCVHKSTKTHAK